MGTDPDYYAQLGVAPFARPEEIRRAYRARARQLHPDLTGAQPGDDDRMAELNAAWAVLRDPLKRARYDRGLEIGTTPIGTTPDADNGFATDTPGTAHAPPRPKAPPPSAHRRASPVLAVVRVAVAFSLAAGAPLAGLGFASGTPGMVAIGFAALLFGAVGTLTLVLLAMRPSRAQVRRGRRPHNRRRSSSPRRRSR